MNRAPEHHILDVLVIGGGAAGLTAATVLARFGRDVELIDAGHPRNAPAAGVHNLLGHDGLPPLELQARGKDELRRFGGRVTTDDAVGAARVDTHFEVTLASGERRAARRLIVASGVRDILPDIDGLATRWGHDVLHCPYCHGFEVRGQAIGIIATSPNSLHQALLFRELSDDVVVFLHTGAAQLSDEQFDQLAARDIAVVAGRIAAVEVSDDAITAVRLADGRTVARQALVVAPEIDITNAVLDDLGAPRSDEQFGGYVHDAAGATPVPGVWVAGNVAAPLAPVVLAAAAGFAAGGAVNTELMNDHLRAALEARATASVPAGTRAVAAR